MTKNTTKSLETDEMPSLENSVFGSILIKQFQFLIPSPKFNSNHPQNNTKSKYYWIYHKLQKLQQKKVSKLSCVQFAKKYMFLVYL